MRVGILLRAIPAFLLMGCLGVTYTIQPSIAVARAQDDTTGFGPVGRRTAIGPGLLAGVQHESGLGFHMDYSLTKMPQRFEMAGKTSYAMDTKHESLDALLNRSIAWQGLGTTLEVFAGIRRTEITSKEHVCRSFAFPECVDGLHGADWLDVVVGLGVRQKILDNLSVHMRGDYGGLQFDSERIYRLQAGITQDVSESFAIDLQYRFDYYRHENSIGHLPDYEFSKSALMLGFAYRF